MQRRSIDQGFVADLCAADALHIRRRRGQRLAEQRGVQPRVRGQRGGKAAEEAAVQRPHGAAYVVHQRLRQLFERTRQLQRGGRVHAVQPRGAGAKALVHVDYSKR